jgi:hypothetical protein
LDPFPAGVVVPAHVIVPSGKASCHRLRRIALVTAASMTTLVDDTVLPDMEPSLLSAVDPI